MRSRLGRRFFLAASAEPSAGVPSRLSSVQNSRSACAMWICAFGKLRLQSADMVDVRVGGNDMVDVIRVDSGLLEIGHQPAHRVVALELIPVSNSASLSPVLITSAFWSSTTLSAGRK